MIPEQNIPVLNFFADDNMLYSIILDKRNSAADLNHELGIIQDWAYQWKMAFNPNPNKQAVVLIFRKRNYNCSSSPSFNDVEVKKVDSHKNYGLTLDPKLTFDGHINEKISKAGTWIIRYLSFFTPVKTLNEIYKLFARPHLAVGKVQTVINYTKNWVGNPFQTEDGIEV